jgi:hypothetical protein
MLDRYTHSGKNASKAITGVIWFEGSSPPEPKPKDPLPSDSFPVYAAADGLAFRNAPSITGALIKRLPLNARLETLENQAEAEAKIGEYGQWIQIQDSAGDQGYTAAWYVSKTVSEETEPPEPKPPAKPSDDVEFYLVPIADGLAVRTKPDFNAQLIKRIPLQTKLGYLESRAEVNKKVGIVNQWIHVYDESGLKGYTAAWYVTRKAGKPPPPPSESPPPLSKPPEEPKPKTPPDPITGFAVVPMTDGLAFRTHPLVSDNTLIRRLSLHTTLAVDEPEDQARTKIGVNGQWLKVKDASRKVGYVAAWYVKIAPKSEESDGDEDLALRTTTEGVALRRSPVVADHTLIKRLPDQSIILALEPDAGSMVGDYGKWLRVRDSSGVEGYIAAWYVEAEGE